jgi:hypothetical protein
MKSSYFTVGRKLTPEEWGELKSWRAANPDLRWRKGEAREDGFLFWQYTSDRPNGERWYAPDKFEDRVLLSRKVGKAYSNRNPEVIKRRRRAAYMKDPAKIKAVTKAWAKANPDKARGYQTKWRQENPEKTAETYRRWKERNLERYRKYQREYSVSRRKRDPLFVLAGRARSRASKAIRLAGFSKKTTTDEILGCSWAQLKEHIEAQFSPGMSWSNRHLWHIDHIIPIASAATEDDLIAVCHYTNLQPLWAAENLRKSDKLPA